MHAMKKLREKGGDKEEEEGASDKDTDVNQLLIHIGLLPAYL